MPNKRLKEDGQNVHMQQQTGNRPAQPAFFLSQQQLQTLQFLQQNQGNLNAQQEQMLQQLSSQYRLMQQYEETMRTSNEQGQLRSNADIKPIVDELANSNVPPPYPGSKNSSANNDKSKDAISSLIDSKEFLQMSPSDEQNELGRYFIY